MTSAVLRRDAAEWALIILTATALACDKNVLKLITGQSSPRECVAGMGADLKVEDFSM